MATACVRNGDLRGAGVEGLKILPFRTNTLINEALRGVGGERGLGAAPTKRCQWSVARKKLRVVCPERKSKISDGKAHSFGFLIRNLADLMGKRIRISGFECPLVL